MKLHRQHKLILSYTALVLWMMVIFWLSSEGHDASSARSDAIVNSVRSLGVHADSGEMTFVVRKTAHTVAYMVLGSLAYLTLRQHNWRARTTVVSGVLLTVAYAVSDEFHQSFVAGRSGELRDVLIDSTAGLVGICIIYFIYHKYLLQNSQK